MLPLDKYNWAVLASLRGKGNLSGEVWMTLDFWFDNYRYLNWDPNLTADFRFVFGMG